MALKNWSHFLSTSRPKRRSSLECHSKICESQIVIEKDLNSKRKFLLGNWRIWAWEKHSLSRVLKVWESNLFELLTESNWLESFEGIQSLGPSGRWSIKTLAGQSSRWSSCWVVQHTICESNSHFVKRSSRQWCNRQTLPVASQESLSIRASLMKDPHLRIQSVNPAH